jgi:type 1 fimbriae regulatory protein FimB/type 1 fimbriae regulatory protein FimE
MDNSNAVLIAPSTVNCTVTLRKPNAELRTREHLTTDEVEKLIDCASRNRQGYRDGLMVLLAFRHGLRAAEVCDLRWEQIDFATATLYVRRIKHGTPATHPLTGREMRALRKHQRGSGRSAFVFVSERGAPLSAPGFSRMVERAGRAAKLGIKVHAHMLRHACGYALANAGHATLVPSKPTSGIEASRTRRGTLLQALFMIVRVLPTTSAITIIKTSKGEFITTSLASRAVTFNLRTNLRRSAS